jgi:hypothetical protein
MFSHRERLLITVFTACAAAVVGHAQQTLSDAPVRYHFGDEPGQVGSSNPSFAAPDFNDSTWTIAPNGSYPLPPFQSDGVVWFAYPLAHSA